MPLFKYTGTDLEGKKVTGEMTVLDNDSLYLALKKDNIFLTEYTQIEKKKRVKPLSSLELSEFCRQLTAMVASGITLSRSLNIILMGNLKPNITLLLTNVQQQVQMGQPLSEALASQEVFPDMMVNMFRAGEASGQMESVSRKLAVYYEKDHRLKTKIQTATMYPKILLVVCLAAVLIIFLFVVPKLEDLFFSMEVPLLTRILIAFSNFLRDYWYIAGLVILSCVALWQVLITLPVVRFAVDKLKVKLPIMGRQLRVIYTARFARSQSSLYASGLSMIHSMHITASTLSNKYLEIQLTEAAKKVRSGDMLSHAIQAVVGFDAKLAPTIFVGEETGRLDHMLETIADSYEHEADIALDKLTALIEPVMIVIMGVLVCLIMVGVLVPIWNMYSGVA